MILKILLVILVISIVYFMFIKKKPITTADKTDTTNKKDKPQSNDMVACTTCGTYAALSDTILASNKYYCSSECVDKA